MECYYHPDREGTDTCAICGKNVCKECCLEIAGKTYCKECLEKIVGLSLNTQEKEEPARLEKQPEEPVNPEPVIERPVRLEKQPEEPVRLEKEPASLYKSDNFDDLLVKQPIADDSPYNIKENISYEAETYTQDNYQPPEVQQSLHQAIEQINEKPTPTQNELPSDGDYIYPDHSYEPSPTASNMALEDKYERYLDDLYFDEDEIPLEQQLAKDEEKYGSLTREPKPVYNQAPPRVYVEGEEDDLDRRIREELAREQQRKNGKPIHNINYQDEKEPYGVVDIILTIILIIVILIVLYYVVYLFFLSSTYPTFTDALFGLTNPQNVINAILQ